MDIGLAKPIVHDPSLPFPLTNGDFTVGTPGYMCPEQAKGEEMDHRGDLYSVGAILFELLAGRLPFSGASTMDVLMAHATEEPPRFADVGALGFVSAPVESVVLKCLAKNPDDRPSSARELAERYEQALLEQEAGTEVLENDKAPAAAPVRNGTPASAPVLANDPLAQIHYLEAWMPEKIAAYKLRGFVQDVGGELLESVPGRIRVRFGGRNCAYEAPRDNSFSWFGLARKSNYIDMELHLHRPDPGRDNLQITVVLRPGSRNVSNDERWRNRCVQIFCDLRGYLMGQTGAVG
jgi:serine/threonine-protein kinase